MLKWADETRRKLDSTDNESSLADTLIINSVQTTEEEHSTETNSALLMAALQSSKAVSPVQKRKQRNVQTSKEKRRHSSCGKLYASPDQIVIAWNNSPEESMKGHRRQHATSLPSTPTDISNKGFQSNDDSEVSPTTETTQSRSPPMLIKPVLLQLAAKESDKNRSFLKYLKKSWPSRTYKSPATRKSHSVIETYRKIEESYYTESDCGENKQNSNQDNNEDYGLSDLVISLDSPNDCRRTKQVDGSIRSYHSLKTIRRQSDSRRPKLFVRRTGNTSRSPDSGFSDIRLSMTDDLDTERDSGVPRSPTLSSASSSGDDSTC